MFALMHCDPFCAGDAHGGGNQKALKRDRPPNFFYQKLEVDEERRY